MREINKDLLIPKTAKFEEIYSYSHNRGLRRLVVKVNYLDESSTPFLSEEITIKEDRYDYLMGTSPSFPNGKSPNEFREDDLWHVIDTMRDSDSEDIIKEPSEEIPIEPTLAETLMMQNAFLSEQLAVTQTENKILAEQNALIAIELANTQESNKMLSEQINQILLRLDERSNNDPPEDEVLPEEGEN